MKTIYRRLIGDEKNLRERPKRLKTSINEEDKSSFEFKSILRVPGQC
jgi:hypothetical protein